VIAASWSAPGWMKFGGTFTGTCQGSLNYLINGAYPVYASYLAKFVTAYSSGYGVQVYAVSMQNEPRTCSSGYATMNMQPADESNFALNLRSALDAAGFPGVKVLAWDSDWYEGGSPTSYPQQVLSCNGGQATGAVDGVAYHCDGSPNGAYSVQSTFHSAYPAKSVYFAECSGGTWAPNAATNLVWEMQNNLNGPLGTGRGRRCIGASR
jgi:glucosylceramidase